MSLRPYQIKSLELLRESAKKGSKKLLLYLATGAGKTVIFIDLIKSITRLEKKVMVVIKRRQVVIQTMRRVQSSISSPVGCVMGDSTIGIDAPVVVSSIDTITARLKGDKKDAFTEYLKSFDVLIIDEAHDCVSPSYVKFLEILDDKMQVGFSATPFHVGRRGHTHWDKIICPIKPKELVEQGYLVPATIFTVPTRIKTESIKITGKDYNNKELFGAADCSTTYGDYVKHYKLYAKNKPAILFAINVEHSKNIVEKFIEAGIEALHLDANSSQTARDEGLKRLRFCIKNEIPFILSNVNLFATGVDVAELEILITTRPTKSKALFKQQVGRVLRPFEGKKKAIIIDHSGNVRFRFGDPLAFDLPDIEDKEKFVRDTEEEPKGFSCPFCFYYMEKRELKCPGCKKELTVVSNGRSITEDESVDLEEYTSAEDIKINTKKTIKDSFPYAFAAFQKKGKGRLETYRSFYLKHGEDSYDALMELGCSKLEFENFRYIRKKEKLKTQIDKIIMGST